MAGCLTVVCSVRVAAVADIGSGPCVDCLHLLPDGHPVTQNFGQKFVCRCVDGIRRDVVFRPFQNRDQRCDPADVAGGIRGGVDDFIAAGYIRVQFAGIHFQNRIEVAVICDGDTAAAGHCFSGIDGEIPNTLNDRRNGVSRFGAGGGRRNARSGLRRRSVPGIRCAHPEHGKACQYGKRHEQGEKGTSAAAPASSWGIS